MKFHVIRGDQFVADILILEVWPKRRSASSISSRRACSRKRATR